MNHELRDGVSRWVGGHGPPVVLLHGGMADAEQHWAPVWDLLAQRFEVVAPDLPGFGRSAPLPDPSWKALAAWVVRVLEDRPPAAIVGNSFGGTLARVVAALHPERVDRLVLVDGGGFVSAPPWVAMLGPLWTLAERRGIPRRSVARMFHGAVPPGLDRDQPGTIWALARGCVAGAPPRGPSGCPTLVVWGVEDRHVPIPRAWRLVEELGRGRVAAIPNAGHLPQVEQPGAFLEAVRPFL